MLAILLAHYEDVVGHPAGGNDLNAVTSTAEALLRLAGEDRAAVPPQTPWASRPGANETGRGPQ